MGSNSVITLEKPLNHSGLSDWHSRVAQLRTVAESKHKDSFQLRHQARALRNETRIETDWNTYHNNAKLSDRIAEVSRWRVTVETCFQRIEREIRLLKDEKSATERELEAMITPLLVVSDCLSMRDQRLTSELTSDDTEKELKNELSIVESNQKVLRDQCQSAWEKLNRLDEVKFKLNLEIENKKEAEQIDSTQLDLDKFSSNITFKTCSTRIPKNSCTHEGWLEHTKNIKKLADEELADTYAVRESLFVAREKAKNILKAQQDRTEHSIRKRIFETQRARNELEWQKMKMKNEHEKCLTEIKTLEQSLRDKTNCLKLAETRLENRAQRSGIELCNDEAYQGLCDEVFKLRKIREALMEQIETAKTVLTSIDEHIRRTQIDLSNKQHSLMTDIKGLDLRARLKSDLSIPEFNSYKKTDRKIELKQMHHEIAPEI